MFRTSVLFIIIKIAISTVFSSASFAQSRDQYFWLPDSAIYRPLSTMIPVPDGYTRIEVPPHSFAAWLRGLPMHHSGTPVRDYTGRIRVPASDSTLAAVAHYNIHGRKLEQCMDIIQRWWAEYLYVNHNSDEITFAMPGGQFLNWQAWSSGLRPHFEGVHYSLQPDAAFDSSRQSLESYLWTVFYTSYTQTAAVAYPTIKFDNLQIGDFIIREGSRGHAVLIVDLARNDEGELIGLLGNGDTPARQFFILNYHRHQPWFPLSQNQGHIPLPFKKQMSWSGLRRLLPISAVSDSMTFAR
ncbi:hypothetical protein JW960_17890 [candidate division KSB1 bacterium]|nr:hypothetical protein [candidate division KSB1 bacterium]